MLVGCWRGVGVVVGGVLVVVGMGGVPDVVHGCCDVGGVLSDGVGGVLVLVGGWRWFSWVVGVGVVLGLC